MYEFLTELLKIISRPTWRKVVMFCVVAVTGVLLLCAYEFYTASFRLSRLQNEADLLVRIREINAQNTNNTGELNRVQDALLAQAKQMIEERSPRLILLPATVEFQMDTLWKFLAGGALWIVVALCQIPKLNTPKGRKEFSESLIAAAVAGFFAIFVRAIWWPWFHLFIYPLLFLLGIFVAVLPFLIVVMLRRAKAKALEITCLNNLKQVGLAARLWAGDHNDVFPKDMASMKEELGTEKVTTCPADRKRRYEILSPGLSEIDPTRVYARCPIHNNYVLGDGSAHLPGKRKLHQQDGVWKIESE